VNDERATTADTCLNCGAPVRGPFCSSCGVRTTSAIPGTRDFLTGLWEEVGGVERRFLRTFLQTLTRPGQTTLDIAEGRGALHVSPLRMYLALALAYFAVAAMSPGDVPLVVGFGLVNGDDFVNLWVPRILILGIPAFAALLWLFYRHSGYVRHLVFSVYLHAMVYAMNTAVELGVLVSGWLGVDEGVSLAPVLNVWFFGYLFFGLRRLEGGWRKPLGVTPVVLVAYALIWGLLTVGLLLASGAFTLEQLLSGTRAGG
jgi:hypothetical protein